MSATITRPVTPAVEAIGRLNITGNVTPHVWYQRSEFRSEANRPDRNMITAVADILYWYRPREVRDEEAGGVFVGHERKFQRDMLQYDYGRRAAVFGMSEREMREACNRAEKRGLIKIEYRTEKYRGRLLHNVVYVEPVAEAIALTLAGPNVEVTEKPKGAKRGRHARASQEPRGQVDAERDGVDDQTPEGESLSDQGEALSDFEAAPPETRTTSQNSVTFPNGGAEGTSQNSVRSTSQNFEGPRPKFWDTYHETSDEISSSRDFQKSSSISHLVEEVADDPDAAAAGSLREEGEGGAPEQPQATPGRAPDGAGADAPGGLPSQTVTEPAQAKERPQPATFSEQIPGGAAAPGYAILALTPIPRAELEARPVREPVALLKGLLYASHKSREAHLTAYLGGVTETGGVPRSLLLRLTAAELQQAQTAARLDAVGTNQMARFAALALDRLIGAPITEDVIEGRARKAAAVGNAVSNGVDKRVVNRAVSRASAPEPELPVQDKIELDSRWERRTNPDDVITIVSMDVGRVETHNGRAFLTYELLKLYRRVQ